MKNNTNSAEAQTQLEPNVQAQPPSVAVETLQNSLKNVEATDGCAAAPCSASVSSQFDSESNAGYLGFIAKVNDEISILNGRVKMLELIKESAPQNKIFGYYRIYDVERS